MRKTHGDLGGDMLAFIEANLEDPDYDRMLEAQLDGECVAAIRPSPHSGSEWAMYFYSMPARGVASEIATRFLDWAAQADAAFDTGMTWPEYGAAVRRTSAGAHSDVPDIVTAASSATTRPRDKLVITRRSVDLPLPGTLLQALRALEALWRALAFDEGAGHEATITAPGVGRLSGTLCEDERVIIRLQDGSSTVGDYHLWRASFVALAQWRLSANSVQSEPNDWHRRYLDAELAMLRQQFVELRDVVLQSGGARSFSGALSDAAVGGCCPLQEGLAGVLRLDIAQPLARNPGGELPFHVRAAQTLLSEDTASHGWVDSTSTRMFGCARYPDARIALAVPKPLGGEAPTPAWSALVAFVREFSAATGNALIYDHGAMSFVGALPRSDDKTEHATPLGEIRLWRRIAATALSDVYEGDMNGVRCAIKVARTRYDIANEVPMETQGRIQSTGSSKPWLLDPAAILRRQFAFMSQIDQPFVPKVHGLTQLTVDGELRTAMVMDWVEGRPALDPALPVGARVRNVGVIARQLITLRAAGHDWLDLKPAHVIARRGLVMFLDPANEAAGADDAACTLFTPAYAWTGGMGIENPHFALGTMLLEALLGRYPFDPPPADPAPAGPLLRTLFESMPALRGRLPLGHFPRCPEERWMPAYKVALRGHQGEWVNDAIEACQDPATLEEFAELEFAGGARAPDWTAAASATDYLMEKAGPPRIAGSVTALAHLDAPIATCHALAQRAVDERCVPLPLFRAARVLEQVPMDGSYEPALYDVLRALGVVPLINQNLARLDKLANIRKERRAALDAWHAEQDSHLKEIFGDNLE